jgi:hypothetical protein
MVVCHVWLGTLKKGAKHQSKKLIFGHVKGDGVWIVEQAE